MESLWQAYELAEPDKAKSKNPEKYLTDLVTLVRHAIGYEEWLSACPDVVDSRFTEWLAEQESSGREFTDQQLLWLGMIKDVAIVSDCG